MQRAQELIDYRIPSAVIGPTTPEYPTGDGEGDDAQDYAYYTRGLWDEQNEGLRLLHETWVQNLLFLASKQWLQNIDGNFITQKVPWWREQPVINLCVPYYKTFLAKVTKNRPAISVVPASASLEDVQAASLAQEVLEAKWTELRLDRTLRRAVQWTIVTGNAFLYPYWNTSTGKMRRLEVEMEVPTYEEIGGEKMETGTEVMIVPCDEDGDPILDEDGRPKEGAEAHVIDQGEIGVKVLSPFQVRVNPDAEDDEDVSWFIIGEVMTLREIQRLWPEAFEGDDWVPSSEDVGALEDYQRAFAGILGGDQKSAQPKDQRDRNLAKALVLFYHEIPSAEYPNGRYWVCTKDGLLEKPQELPEGVWPALIHLSDLEMPGRYHAASTFENIVELNREYNELNASIKEHHNLFIRGKWLVPKGSGIKKGSITLQPGEVVEHNPGFEPKQMDLKPLPGAVYNERQRVKDDYELVSGIHKVSMGTPPPGVTAGVAFLQLQEADDSDIGPFLSMLEGSVAQLGRSELQIIKERYTDERLVLVAGPNRKFQIRSFRAADLSGAADVVPVSESSFPWSKTARQSMLLTLAQQMPQLFADPETGQFDRARFARMLPIGGLDQFADQEDIDIQEAQNEEDIFASYGMEDETGLSEMQLPIPQWWQNHEVHFNQHVRILKSDGWHAWSDEAREKFLEHVQATMAMRDQKRAELNIANGGTPPGGQKPPGPDAPPDQLMEQQASGEGGMDQAFPDQMQGAAGPPAAAQQQAMIENLNALRGE